ncbi:Mannosyltransferase [Frankia sp. AiPs1]|uniref:hypothetical protein n=1 Tax=Frankia sp. AiPa1 TaxID=573492 RepID=UPI00202B5CF1|nr:hypothetical protein [Frankia sp. AiPa1]MCL9759708.1 hypothetical protein [Frankia sp. AiPa1]
MTAARGASADPVPPVDGWQPPPPSAPGTHPADAESAAVSVRSAMGGRHAGTRHPRHPDRARRPRRRADPWRCREVVLAWLAARVVVGAALAMTHFLADQASGKQNVTLKTTGLLGWDAGWYRTIAETGYSGAGADSRRFFPLLPTLVRALAQLPGAGGHAGDILLLIVNGCALGLALALVRLARVEGLGEDTTFRLIWFTALAPPAFVLVMGYAEALAGLLAVVVFLGARTRRFELAAAAGLLGGLCRPLGVLLAVPIAIEAARGLPVPLARRLGPPPGALPAAAAGSPPSASQRSAATLPAATPSGATPSDATPLDGGPSDGATSEATPSDGRPHGESLGWRMAAILAPLAGAGIYVVWSAHTYGDGFAPFTIQRDAARHGAASNPVSVLWHAARGAFHGELGTGLHVPWILLAITGLVVMYRRLPVSYALWSTLVLAAVLTGSNLDSAERYLYGAFPFLLVAALVTARREIFTAALVACTAAMTLYATLAFTLAYVP